MFLKKEKFCKGCFAELEDLSFYEEAILKWMYDFIRPGQLVFSCLVAIWRYWRQCVLNDSLASGYMQYNINRSPLEFCFKKRKNNIKYHHRLRLNSLHNHNRATALKFILEKFSWSKTKQHLLFHTIKRPWFLEKLSFCSDTFVVYDLFQILKMGFRRS